MQPNNPKPEEGAIEIKQSFTQLGEIQKQFSEEQMKFVMENIAPGLNQKETWLFLLKAQTLGLNPLMGELTAFAVEENGRRRLVTIAARDAKRRKAEQSRKLEWMKTTPIYIKKQTILVDSINEKGDPRKITNEVTIAVEPWEGTLWGAQTEIKRSDREQTIVVQVPLAEYKDERKPIWQRKPETMIKKVSQSQALSEAFPELFADIYDESEDWRGEANVKVPEIEGGSEPATPELLKTIEVMGGDKDRTYTKQEAIETIANLRKTKKGKGK